MMPFDMQDDELGELEDLGGTAMSMETSRETARLLAMLAASGSSKVSQYIQAAISTSTHWGLKYLPPAVGPS